MVTVYWLSAAQADGLRGPVSQHDTSPTRVFINMEYYTLLERETVEELRKDFLSAIDKRREGIDIYSFVRTLLKYWPTDNLEEFIGPSGQTIGPWW